MFAAPVAALSLLLLMCVTAAAQPASGDLVVRESKLSVKASVDALAKALEAKGVRIVARVDHAAGAKSVGMELAPAELIIFGDPRLGTPLIRSNPQIGIDLPMRVLAWQDKAGKVLVAYTRPDVLKARYGITDADPQFAAMANALAAFTTAATGN